MPSLTDIPWIATTLLIADWFVRVGLALRVVMRRRPVGVSLSWLGVILFLPILGAVLYLIFGEAHIGRIRKERFEHIQPAILDHLKRLANHAAVDLDQLTPPQYALVRHSFSRYGFPLLSGNALELLSDSDVVFDRLIEDIDQAKHHVHLAFYIWWPGGRVEAVIDALGRAAKRGVTCRVLADAVGSKTFLQSPACVRLRSFGVEIVEALPIGIWRMAFRRQDLRNHRKIAVIDGEVGYTGSQNMADPAYFKRDAGFGPWRDAMVRVTGPAAETLGLVFLSDFDIETEEKFGDFEARGGLHRVAPTGDIVTQLLPSGPGFAIEAIRETLLTAIFGAQEELVLTTPYFVPDEPLLEALISAAKRGVEVTLIVPEQIDSVLARLASRSQYADLLNAGIRVMLFRGGLLHTKTLVADRMTTLIGTVNLDMRSLWLNFEITLAVFDRDFSQEVRALQDAYATESVMLVKSVWETRPFHTRLVENMARLLGPLL